MTFSIPQIDVRVESLKDGRFNITRNNKENLAADPNCEEQEKEEEEIQMLKYIWTKTENNLVQNFRSTGKKSLKGCLNFFEIQQDFRFSPSLISYFIRDETEPKGEILLPDYFASKLPQPFTDEETKSCGKVLRFYASCNANDPLELTQNDG